MEGVLGPITLGVKALAARLTVEQIAVLTPHSRRRYLALLAGVHGVYLSLYV